MSGGARKFSAAMPDGTLLQAVSQGEGPTSLLLISGLAGTATFWSSTAAALARSFRVITFDQRGLGGSTRGTAPCTVDQLARDCLAVLEAAGVASAVVLGHSTGGCIGQSLARQQPERAAALILSGCWLTPSRYMSTLFAMRRKVLEQDPVSYAASSALVGFQPAWLEANWRHYEAAIADAPVSAERRQVILERLDALLSFDGAEGAAELTMPCLVMGANDDMVVPVAQQKALAAAIPQARTYFFESGGHFFPVSRPDAFTATVADWVGQLA